MPAHESPVGDTFFEATFGPLQRVRLLAEPVPGAPTQEEVWESWLDRCVYVGDEDFAPGRQYRAQVVGKNERSYPALHAAHAVRIALHPVIEVANAYPSGKQSRAHLDSEYDRDATAPSFVRSKTGERLLKRGDRMWAEIGAWPWALEEIREKALGEKLPPRWTILDLDL